MCAFVKTSEILTDVSFSQIFFRPLKIYDFFQLGLLLCSLTAVFRNIKAMRQSVPGDPEEASKIFSLFGFLNILMFQVNGLVIFFCIPLEINKTLN